MTFYNSKRWKEFLVESEHKDQIAGGLADRNNPRDFDPVQLKKGIKVEFEHTKDHNLAQEIAMDHLSEDPEYYSKLDKAGL